MQRSTLFAVLIFLQCVAGCEKDVGEPWIEIVVKQNSGQVSFEFYQELKERAQVRVGSLIIGKSDLINWEIRKRDFRTGAYEIKFGVVPSGYDEIIPKLGGAVPLEDGVEYQVTAMRNGYGWSSFIYNGSR